MSKTILFIVISALLFICAGATFGYMNSPLTTGSYSLFYNPSFLGRTDTPWHSWELDRFRMGFSNDLVSPAFTAYIFENAATAGLLELPYDTINDEKKQRILHDIGDYFNLEEHMELNLLPLGLKFGGFAMATELREAAYIQLPNALFDLMLYGNHFDSTYNFQDFYFETQVLSQIALGFGGGVDLEGSGRLNFGAALSYLTGWEYLKVSPDSFFFESDSTHLRIVTRMNLDVALPIPTTGPSEISGFEDFIDPDNISFASPPGHGFDINAGVSWNINDQWMVEGSFNHIFSRVFWRSNAHTYTFFMATDSLNVINLHRIITSYDSLPDDLRQDSIMHAILGDSFIIGDSSFVSVIEPEVNAGVSYTMPYMPLNLFGRYTQGFKNTAFSSKVPQFTFGLQYTAWHFLLLESMFSIGGKESFNFNLGIGFNFDNFTSDINVTQDRGAFYYQKGIHAGLASCSHSRIFSVFSGTIIDSMTNLPVKAKVMTVAMPGKKVDSLYADSLGNFIKKMQKATVKVVVTADKYDTLTDSFYIRTNGRIDRLYKLNPSMGNLLVQVVSGITKKPIANASVIFTDGDTLMTDADGKSKKSLDEGIHAVTVKSGGRDDVVFTIEMERGKDVSYLVEMYPTHGKLFVKTYNATTKEPIKSMIKIYTLDMKTIVDSFDNTDAGADTSKGIKKGFYNVRIDPLVPKYIKQDKYNIEIKGGLVENLEVGLLKEAMVFVFNNILFDYNKATLRKESYPVCDSLAMIMKENPSIKVEIGGHTDSRGSSSYNRKLSQSRAESVRNYLISKHSIDSKRIIAKGYGEDVLLISPEKNEADYQTNRRVEFKVLKGE
ncbi:MAG: OmpA family protein [bacterium]|nr:OmpA family protein [bacterium]